MRTLNRGQKYPLQGVTRFNQVVIKLQQDAKILALHRMRCVTLALDQTGSLRYSKSHWKYILTLKRHHDPAGQRDRDLDSRLVLKK